MKIKKNYVKYFLLFLFISSFILQFFCLNLIFFTKEVEVQGEIQLSAQIPGAKQWIKNPNFTSQEFWTSSEQGDESDVDATISGDQANLMVLGETGTISFSGVPNSTWTVSPNYQWGVLPDNHGFDDNGSWVSYRWYEGDGNETGQTPSIHWEKDIMLPFDMEDYRITSASIGVIFNATVQATPSNGGGIDVSGDSYDRYDIGDWARFYASIEDLENEYQPFELARNRTHNLGSDGPPAITNITDTFLVSIEEELLIEYLELVLGVNSTSFKIILGIDMYCEDNIMGMDDDIWESLRFNSYNLTFTYEKKINQFTSVTWNQDGDRISDISNYTVLVNEAVLSFKYKIDQAWPTASSPNAEIRALINTFSHSETIKLSEVNTTFQQVKVGGFDVSSLITDYVNFSIQVYLRDEFRLDRGITISIDEISLLISYIIIEPDEPIERPDWSWLIYTLGIGIIGLVTFFSLYQTRFKYPPMVRKIRKLRKKVRKSKKLKPMLFKNRDVLLQNNLQNRLKVFKGEPIKEVSKIKNIPSKKIKNKKGK